MSNLDEKKVQVDELKQIAEQAFSAIAVDYRGTDVPKLAKKALEDTKSDSLSEVLTGPTLLAISLEDYQSAAKLIKDFSANEESFQVKGLSIGEGFLSAQELNSLASLPSKEEAISMLLGLLNAPVQKLVSTINEVPSSFVRALAAFGETKS